MKFIIHTVLKLLLKTHSWHIWRDSEVSFVVIEWTLIIWLRSIQSSRFGSWLRSIILTFFDWLLNWLAFHWLSYIYGLWSTIGVNIIRYGSTLISFLLVCTCLNHFKKVRTTFVERSLVQVILATRMLLLVHRVLSFLVTLNGFVYFTEHSFKLLIFFLNLFRFSIEVNIVSFEYLLTSLTNRTIKVQRCVHRLDLGVSSCSLFVNYAPTDARQFIMRVLVFKSRCNSKLAHVLRYHHILKLRESWGEMATILLVNSFILSVDH